MSMKSILPPVDESAMNNSDNGIGGYASKCMDEMAEQLATLCYTLGGQPTLWYQNGCSYTQPFSHKVRERLIDMKTSEVKNTTSGATNQATDTKITQYPVLILDRGFDLISCLVHDMYYQAISYDVLGGDKIELEKQTYNHTENNGEITSHQLDDTDSIWDKFKHTHVAEVFKAFPTMVKDAKKKEDARNSEEGKTNMKQLKRDVQELTKDKKHRTELKVHGGITHNLNGKIQYNNIATICDVEQELVTKGIMSKILPGNAPKDNFERQLINKEMSKADKIRLLCIYILSENGIPDHELKAYISNAQTIGDDKEVFENLSHYIVSSDVEDGKKKLGVQLQNKTKRRKCERIGAANPDPNLFGTKWIPVLKDLIGIMNII
jgi:syntaxin-binding protein 1